MAARRSIWARSIPRVTEPRAAPAGASHQAVGLDWAVRAKRYHQNLSPSQPMSANVYVHPRPRPLELDVHEGIEAGIVLAGIDERHFPDYVVPGIPGDAWVCAMWEPHGWRVPVPNTENVIITFLPEFLGDEMLGEIPWLSILALPPSQRPYVDGEAMRRKVLALGRELKEELGERRAGWETGVRLALLRLLFILTRDWRPPARIAGHAELSTANLSRIMPVLDAFHQDPAHHLHLDQAAAMCGLSKSRFAIVFRKMLGMSFGDFCLRSRLAYAAHCLLTTRSAVEHIARQIGFVDASHLHRNFVRHYGCTPGQYRQQAR